MENIIEKKHTNSGADERTPSKAQYFSWVNNTNEGSTEKHTLINLEYFRWLRDTYGMQLDIYAWDAGNLDGPGYYDHPGSPRLKEHFPDGYGPLADAAAEIGCSLGMWMGPDGFGNTPEEAEKRREVLVSLCRDYGFKQFKFDGVCGNLREEKRDELVKTLDECRKYMPDLIALNHRIDLGDAADRLTTFLWYGKGKGDETYIDVQRGNERTGSHHRVCNLDRGHSEGLRRLAEDHGVCLSSGLDYFEDDLIMQAFARCFILAPEIYANPWFLRDREQARLARIYNLHRKYRDILVDGIILPLSYGDETICRGDGSTRLMMPTNPNWEKIPLCITVSDEIGLTDPTKKYIVKTIHPYESYVGTFAWGETANVTVEPFRCALILVQEEEKFLREDYVLTNCTYETVYGPHAVPGTALIFSGNGQPISSIGNISVSMDGIDGDNTIQSPVLLGTSEDCPLPENVEQLYETTMFRADNDSFEAQCIKRSGPTKIPEVQAARDAFFAQDMYKHRHVESRFMFDGDPDTAFGNADPGASNFYYKTKVRIRGGCLRVDLGETLYASRVEIEYMGSAPSADAEGKLPYLQADTSTDLLHYSPAPQVSSEAAQTQGWVLTYSVNNEMRYFRLPEPMCHIRAFRVYDENGVEVKLGKARGNNLLAPFAAVGFRTAQKVEITIPENAKPGMYLAAAIEGQHGVENAYCTAWCDGKPIAFDDRAASYPVNCWEFWAVSRSVGYTYYLYLTPELIGKKITVYALYGTPMFDDMEETRCDVWLCDRNDSEPLCVIDLIEK